MYVYKTSSEAVVTGVDVKVGGFCAYAAIEIVNRVSIDSINFLILYLVFDLRHPDKVEKPIPIMDQSLGDDHSNKCSDISIQYAINIFFC